MNDRNNDFDRCPSCGAMIQGKANYCPVCRSALKEYSGRRDYPPRYDDDYRRPGGNSYPRHGYPGKPDNYLVWAILCAIFLCVPFGIVAIAYSTQVDSLWGTGHHEEAAEVSRKAKNWCVYAAIIGLVFYLFLFVLLYLTLMVHGL